MPENFNITDFTEKRVEKSISSIGAKIADANELAEQIEDLSEKAEDKLCEAQEELSDLYISLPEDTKIEAKRPPKTIPAPKVKKGAKGKGASKIDKTATDKKPPIEEAD